MAQNTYSTSEVDAKIAAIPAGKQGPIGPQGPAGPQGNVGPTANIDALTARVKVLEDKLAVVPPPVVVPPVTGSAFKVQGADLMSPAGVKFIPLGFNLGSPASADGNGIALGHSADVVAFGASVNTIRLTVNVTDNATWKRRASAGYAQLLADVDAVVAEYTAKKIVVMVEAHDSAENQAQGTQFWKDVVAKHKANPYVWVNYMNEYGWTDAADYLAHQQAWLAEVRGAGYTGPFIADCINAGQDAGWGGAPQVFSGYGATLLNADPLKNVVFSHHNYGGIDDGMGSATYYDKVRAANLAMIVGEFGTTYDGSNQGLDPRQTNNGMNSVVTLARSKGVGGIMWHGSHNDHYSVRNDGGPVWGSAPLSDMGNKLKVVFN